MIFFPTLIFIFFYFLPQNFSPLVHFPDDITSPYPFSHVIFFQKALKLHSPLLTLKFFPKWFDKFPPPQGWGIRNFIHPWIYYMLFLRYEETVEEVILLSLSLLEIVNIMHSWISAPLGTKGNILNFGFIKLPEHLSSTYVFPFIFFT